MARQFLLLCAMVILSERHSNINRILISVSGKYVYSNRNCFVKSNWVFHFSVCPQNRVVGSAKVRQTVDRPRETASDRERSRETAHKGGKRSHHVCTMQTRPPSHLRRYTSSEPGLKAPRPSCSLLQRFGRVSLGFAAKPNAGVRTAL